MSPSSHRPAGVPRPHTPSAPQQGAGADRAPERSASPLVGDAFLPLSARLLGALDRREVNAVCSPLSAQVALTMIGMGAAGRTRAQLEQVLGAALPELAAATRTLAQVLCAVGDAERDARRADTEAQERRTAAAGHGQDRGGPAEPGRASLVASTWLQEGFVVRPQFLDDLATWFDSEVHAADFVDPAAREAARRRINAWTSEATAGLLEDLVPAGALHAESRLVLVSALHLKAAWVKELSAADGDFTTSAGARVRTSMLHGTTHRWYEDAVCRATALDTTGGELALALVQPRGGVDEVLDAWTAAAGSASAAPGLGALLAGLEDSRELTALTVPALDVAWEASLRDPLVGLGLVDAFDGAADFSGVTGDEDLVIDEVLHKAVLRVDEAGMEVAAATAVMISRTALIVPQRELVLDRPFLVVAYECSTRAPLVLGWIGDPTPTR